MQTDSTNLYPKAILDTQCNLFKSYRRAGKVSRGLISHQTPFSRRCVHRTHVNVYKRDLQRPNDPYNVQRPPGPLLLGPQRSETTCPFCLSGIKTTVKYITTSRTHITAALFSFICCCCCIPYCCNSAKNTVHYCPSCHKYLGTYEK